MRVINILQAIFILTLLVSPSFAEGTPGAIKKQSLRIGFGSCISDPGLVNWQLIQAANPDLFIMLGDGIYLNASDFGDASKILESYEDLYSAPGIKSLRESLKWHAIWDDHDFGPDDADSSFAKSEASKSAFLKFWREGTISQVVPGTIASQVSYGPALILLTDNRSDRINPGSGKNARMFGPQQIDWLTKILKHPEHPLVILASGGQILSSTGEQSGMHQFPEEQRKLLAAIASSPAEVLIISGDLHYAELLTRDLNGKTVSELTSSPLASSIKPVDEIRAKEPFRRAKYHEGVNFGLIEVNSQNGKLSWQAYINNSKGRAVKGLQANGHNTPRPVAHFRK